MPQFIIFYCAELIRRGRRRRRRRRMTYCDKS